MTLGERLSRVHALVAGDVMLDEHVWGNVHRISPEAPVPVVEVLGREHVPGGAANTAAGVVALGGQASLGGVVGTDGAAEVLCDALAEAGVDVEGVLRADGRSTTTKTRIIAHGQQIVRIDEEVRTEVPAAVAERLLDWAQELLGEIDVMIVSDYRKGVLVPSVAQGLIRLANQAGVPSVVDIKGNNLPKYRGATVLTPI